MEESMRQSIECTEHCCCWLCQLSHAYHVPTIAIYMEINFSSPLFGTMRRLDSSRKTRQTRHTHTQCNAIWTRRNSFFPRHCRRIIMYYYFHPYNFIILINYILGIKYKRKQINLSNGIWLFVWLYVSLCAKMPCEHCLCVCMMEKSWWIELRLLDGWAPAHTTVVMSYYLCALSND